MLVVLCTASAVLLVILGTRLTFFGDDWYFLLQRPGIESHGGLDTLLAPHNGNMVPLLALLYKSLAAVFGLRSQLPFRLVMGVTMAALGALVYVLVSRRAGRVAGLAAAAVILFLGPAWEDLLSFGALMDLGGSLLTGLAALLVLESPSPRRDAAACILLICSISFSSAGVPFVIGAAVAIALGRRLAELWIPGVPAALFAIWWAFYGSSASGYLTLHNVEHLPRYVADSVSIGLSSVAGFNHGGLGTALRAGHVLLAVCMLLLGWRLIRGGRPAARVLAPVAVAGSFWILTGATFIPGREAAASRYQLVDATLLIVIAAELAAPARARSLTRGPAALLGALAIAATVSNLYALRSGFDFMRLHSAFAKADLGALEIAGPRTAPTVWLVTEVARDPFLSGVTARRYFSVTRAHGVPAHWSPAEIESAPEPERRAADSVLVNAYEIRPIPAPGHSPLPNCRQVAAGAGHPGPVQTVQGPALVLANPSAQPLAVGVARFATSGVPLYVGFLAPHARARIRIPPDGVATAWKLSLLTGSSPTAANALLCSD